MPTHVTDEMRECFKKHYIHGDENSLKKVFRDLRSLGYQQLLTIMLLKEMLGLGLGEAKMLVGELGEWNGDQGLERNT